MRTVVDLDEGLVAQGMRAAKVRAGKELVVVATEELRRAPPEEGAP